MSDTKNDERKQTEAVSSNIEVLVATKEEYPTRAAIANHHSRVVSQLANQTQGTQTMDDPEEYDDISEMCHLAF